MLSVLGLPFAASWLVASAAGTVALQLACFAVAATLKFDKITDLAGGSNFVIVAVAGLLLGSNGSSPRCVAATLGVAVWGTRLSGFLLWRICKIGEDHRFDDLRENCLSFLGFWVFQMVWVYLVSFPVTALNALEGGTGDAAAPLGALDAAGLAVFAAGVVLETIADSQKSAFRGRAENAGKHCAVGVWRYARYPNYCGEIAAWWGMYALCAPHLPLAYAVASLASPFFTMAILLGLSGVPFGEVAAEKRYGALPEWRAYRESTPLLVPVPRAVYGALPGCCRVILCCSDWKCHDKRVVDGGQDTVSNPVLPSGPGEGAPDYVAAP